MALTLSQKILARASGGPAPQPGDMVVARIDRVFLGSPALAARAAVEGTLGG